LKITGDLGVDLRSNIAAEARAKIVYERLIDFTQDQGSIDALQFLMTREITHMKAFQAALDSLVTDPFAVGNRPPTPGLVDEYFDTSTGEGDEGVNQTGPWNKAKGITVVEAPALQALGVTAGRNGN
jgi:Mn-containing catalase